MGEEGGKIAKSEEIKGVRFQLQNKCYNEAYSVRI